MIVLPWPTASQYHVNLLKIITDIMTVEVLGRVKMDIRKSCMASTVARDIGCMNVVSWIRRT